MPLWSKLLPLKHCIKSLCALCHPWNPKPFLFIFTVMAMRQIQEEIGKWQVWWGWPVKIMWMLGLMGRDCSEMFWCLQVSHFPPSAWRRDRFAHVLCPREHKLKVGSLPAANMQFSFWWKLGRVEGFSSPSVIIRSGWLISGLCACSRTEFSGWRWEGLLAVELCH